MMKQANGYGWRIVMLMALVLLLGCLGMSMASADNPNDQEYTVSLTCFTDIPTYYDTVSSIGVFSIPYDVRDSSSSVEPVWTLAYMGTGADPKLFSLMSEEWDGPFMRELAIDNTKLPLAEGGTTVQYKVKATYQGATYTWDTAIHMVTGITYPTGFDLSVGTFEANNYVVTTEPQYQTVNGTSITLASDTLYVLQASWPGNNSGDYFSQNESWIKDSFPSTMTQDRWTYDRWNYRDAQNHDYFNGYHYVFKTASTSGTNQGRISFYINNTNLQMSKDVTVTLTEGGIAQGVTTTRYELSDGTFALKVDGQGEMDDAESFAATGLNDIKDKIRHIVIGAGVTKLGNNVFSGLTRTDIRVDFLGDAFPTNVAGAFGSVPFIGRYYKGGIATPNYTPATWKRLFYYYDYFKSDNDMYSTTFYYSAALGGWYMQQGDGTKIMMSAEAAYETSILMKYKEYGRSVVLVDAIPESNTYTDSLLNDFSWTKAVTYGSGITSNETVTIQYVRAADTFDGVMLTLEAPNLTYTITGNGGTGEGAFAGFYIKASHGTINYQGSKLERLELKNDATVTVNGDIWFLDVAGETDSNKFTGNLTVHGTIERGSFSGTNMITIPGIEDPIALNNMPTKTMTNVPEQTDGVVFTNGVLNTNISASTPGQYNLSYEVRGNNFNGTWTDGGGDDIQYTVTPETKNLWYVRVLDPNTGAQSSRIALTGRNPNFSAANLQLIDTNLYVANNTGKEPPKAILQVMNYIGTLSIGNGENGTMGLSQLHVVNSTVEINCPVVIGTFQGRYDVTVNADVLKPIEMNLANGGTVKLGTNGHMRQGGVLKRFSDDRRAYYFDEIQGTETVQTIVDNGHPTVMSHKENSQIYSLMPADSAVSELVGAGELGENEKAGVDINETSLEEMGQEEQAALTNYIGISGQISFIVDLSVGVYTPSNGWTNRTISKLSGSVGITLSNKQIQYDQNMRIVRLHRDENGMIEASELAYEYQANGTAFSFLSDRFSKYAIVQGGAPADPVTITCDKPAVDGAVEAKLFEKLHFDMAAQGNTYPEQFRLAYYPVNQPELINYEYVRTSYQATNASYDWLIDQDWRFGPETESVTFKVYGEVRFEGDTAFTKSKEITVVVKRDSEITGDLTYSLSPETVAIDDILTVTVNNLSGVTYYQVNLATAQGNDDSTSSGWVSAEAGETTRIPIALSSLTAGHEYTMTLTAAKPGAARRTWIREQKIIPTAKTLGELPISIHIPPVVSADDDFTFSVIGLENANQYWGVNVYQVAENGSQGNLVASWNSGNNAIGTFTIPKGLLSAETQYRIQAEANGTGYEYGYANAQFAAVHKGTGHDPMTITFEGQTAQGEYTFYSYDEKQMVITAPGATTVRLHSSNSGTEIINVENNQPVVYPIRLESGTYQYSASASYDGGTTWDNFSNSVTVNIVSKWEVGEATLTFASEHPTVTQGAGLPVTINAGKDSSQYQLLIYPANGNMGAIIQEVTGKHGKPVQVTLMTGDLTPGEYTVMVHSSAEQSDKVHSDTAYPFTVTAATDGDPQLILAQERVYVNRWVPFTITNLPLGEREMSIMVFVTPQGQEAIDSISVSSCNEPTNNIWRGTVEGLSEPGVYRLEAKVLTDPDPYTNPGSAEWITRATATLTVIENNPTPFHMTLPSALQEVEAGAFEGIDLRVIFLSGATANTDLSFLLSYNVRYVVTEAAVTLPDGATFTILTPAQYEALDDQ